jgi:ABC-type lipoprotein release transport system permease subunit
VGILAGGLLAAWSLALMERFVFGIPTGDPITAIGVALGLLTIAAIATAVPARKIVKLNPADTLRQE